MLKSLGKRCFAVRKEWVKSLLAPLDRGLHIGLERVYRAHVCTRTKDLMAQGTLNDGRYTRLNGTSGVRERGSPIFILPIDHQAGNYSINLPNLLGKLIEYIMCSNVVCIKNKTGKLL